MKLIFLALTITLTSYAVVPKPLLTKTSGGGFTSPEWSGYEQCEVYSNKVVITHQMGAEPGTNLKVSETRALTFTGDLKLVVETAKAEKLEEKPNFLCDAPSTSVVAGSNEENGVVLFSTGGCGSPRKERKGSMSRRLRLLIDLYCPTTHDHGAEN